MKNRVIHFLVILVVFFVGGYFSAIFLSSEKVEAGCVDLCDAISSCPGSASEASDAGRIIGWGSRWTVGGGDKHCDAEGDAYCISDTSLGCTEGKLLSRGYTATNFTYSYMCVSQ